MTGLYIHVPFCRKVCDYCDFSVQSVPGRLYPEYVDLLLREAELRLRGRRFYTFYLGGGTPSVLPAELLQRLFSGLARLGVRFGDMKELTMEMNPESAFPDRLAVAMDSGIRRFSLGLQTLDDELLKMVGRSHSVKTGMAALERLLSLVPRGIRVNADLMFDLPGQTLSGFVSDVRRIAGSGAGHISVYGLTVSPHTVLGARVRKGELKISEDLYPEMYRACVSELEQAGFHRYEVSNFAKPGEESIHNQNYWDRGEYLGLGPGAHSFEGNVRSAGPSRYAEWRRWVRAGCPSGGFALDTLGKKERVTEIVWLSLRQAKGLDLDALFKTEGVSVPMNAVDCLCAKGWISVRGSHLCLAGDGWLMMDSVVNSLLPSDFRE